MKKFVTTLLLISILSGCKTLKNTTTATDTSALSTESVLKLYEENLFQSKTLSAKLKTTFQNDKGRQSFTIKLRIEKDKTIWMSASYLGITVAKLLMTPDRIQYYEKLNQTYYDSDYTFIKENTGVNFDFQHIQNILLGQAFNGLSENNFQAYVNDNQLVLKYEPYFEDIIGFFTIDTRYHKLAKQEAMESESAHVSVTYEDYQTVDNEIIPAVMRIEVNKNQKITRLDWIFTDLSINQSVSFPFEIPEGYSQVKF